MLILTVSNRNRRSPPPPHPKCLCKSKAGDGFYINKWCEHAKFLWLQSGRGFSKKAGRRGRIRSMLPEDGRAGGGLCHGWVPPAWPLPHRPSRVCGSACPHLTTNPCAPASQIGEFFFFSPVFFLRFFFLVFFLLVF